MCKTALQELCTDCSLTIHRALLSTGRPSKPAAGKDMEVNMEHGLARAGTIIDDHAVALFIQSFFICDFFCGEEEVANKFPVCLGHAVDLSDVPLGNNQ